MHKRMVGVFALMVAMFSGLIFRLFILTQTTEYTQAADRQSSYVLNIDTKRGQIYDCNFTPLVETQTEYIASVLPVREAANTIFAQLETLEEREAVYKQFEEQKPFLYRLKNNDVYSKGIDVFEVTKRYSSTQIAAHVIGYLNGDEDGVYGIEKGYNNYLRDAGGKLAVKYTVDVKGNAVTGEGYSLLEENYSSAQGVVLTIDKEIQQIAEQAAAEHFEKGAVVVMDIYTGEIRAMVSVPTFDPNDIAGAIDAENSPLINRATWDYSVGSSFKMLVAATAIEQGYENHTYNCKGYIEIGDTIFYCHNRAGHGALDMRGAMEKSCNPYFISLILKMGGEPVLYKAEELGFNKGWQLAEGISTKAGQLPTYSDLEIVGETANFGFGQGKLMATPVQIAQMVAAIANGGDAVTPKLVVGTTLDGVTIDNYTPTYSPNTVISKSAAVKVQDYMISVVENGSGKNARPYAMGAGGKTASAQTGQFVDGEELVHAWFAGFFPAHDPQYAIVVLAEEMDSGGDFAAPVFKKICDGMVMQGKVQ